jgi:uncharacterized damage-inducible protein DinB
MLDPSEFVDLAAIRQRWGQIETETQVFVDELDEAALKQVVHYINTAGQASAYPLWQLMIHQVNHATQSVRLTFPIFELRPLFI